MLEIRNLSKYYQSKYGKSVKALNDISFQTEDTGMVFITGKSGSGKSTLLNIIGGLDTCDSGDVILDGKSIRTFSDDIYRNAYVGFIFQENNLIDTLNIEDNISIALELQGIKCDKGAINRILESVDLAGYGNRMPNELSTGEKQRVAIARALIKSPKIILADEPTGSLDSKTGILVMDILKNISRKTLVIVVSHDLDLAEKYGDKIIKISEGQLISNITKDDNITKQTLVKEDTDTEYSKNGKDKFGLPLKKCLKLALNNIKRKRIRLLFTIFLSSVAFILGFLSNTMSNYENNQSVIQSLYSRDKNYISIAEGGHASILSLHHHMLPPGLTDNDVEFISTSFPSYNFFKVYRYKDNSFQQNLVNNNDNFNAIYYNKRFNGIVELTNEVMDKLNLKLIAGRLPAQSDSYNEIVVSKYVYSQFEQFGYQDSYGNQYAINTPDDLIGKIINENIIVGIVDTNFDEERYAIFKSLVDVESDIDRLKDVLYSEFTIMNSYGLQSAIFVREGYHDEEFNEIYSIKSDFHEEPFNLYLEYSSNDYTNADIYSSFDSIATFKINPNSIYWENGVQRNKLAHNEILLPAESIEDYRVLGNSESVTEVIQNETDKLVYEFVAEHFDEIKEEFEKTYGVSSEHDYFDYIMDVSPFVNEYHEDKNKLYFMNLATQSFYDNIFPYFDNLGFRRSRHGKLVDKKLKVVGFYDYVDEDIKPIIVSDDVYEEVLETGYGKYSYLLAELKGNEKEDLNLIKFCDSNTKEKDNVYTIYDEVTVNNAQMNSILRVLKDVFIYIGIGFAVFASLLQFNFITASIYNKKREIGILRALGATRKDVFSIFMLESMLISGINYIISLLGTITLSIIINEMFKTKYYLLFSLSHFTLRQILLLFIITFITGIVSTIIPIISISSKKPNEVIKSI